MQLTSQINGLHILSCLGRIIGFCAMGLCFLIFLIRTMSTPSHSSIDMQPLSSINQTLNQERLLDPRIQELDCGFSLRNNPYQEVLLCDVTLFPLKEGGDNLQYKNTVKTGFNAFFTHLGFNLTRGKVGAPPRLKLALDSGGIDFISKKEALALIVKTLDEQTQYLNQGQFPVSSKSNRASWSEEDFQ